MVIDEKRGLHGCHGGHMWVPWRGRGPVRVNRTESWRDIAVQRADVSNSKHWSAKGPGARARGGVIEF